MIAKRKPPSPKPSPAPTLSLSELSRLTGIPQKSIKSALKPLPASASIEETVVAIARCIQQFAPSRAADTLFEMDTPEQIRLRASQHYSISALAEMLGMDRATISRGLADVHHVEGAKGAKLYALNLALPALLTGTKEDIKSATLRKTTAEAELKEIRVQIERGELLATSDVREYLQSIFKRLHTYFVLQSPREHAASYRKLKTTARLITALKKHHAKVFDDLRKDHARLL